MSTSTERALREALQKVLDNAGTPEVVWRTAKHALSERAAEQPAEPDERATFRRWAKTRGYDMRGPDGSRDEYDSPATAGAWDAWMARSRRPGHNKGRKVLPNGSLSERAAEPTRADLRRLVDHVWNEAKESQEVTNTAHVDRMIDHVFSERGAEQPASPTLEQFIAALQAFGWTASADAQHERIAELHAHLFISERAAEQPAAGWKLVPTEPTEAMHAAAVRTVVRCNGNADFPPRVWRAMLAAAPAAQTSAEPEGALTVSLDESEACLLRNTIGHDGDCPPITLSVGPGVEGFGLYVWLTDYPEEGSIQLKALAARTTPAASTSNPP